MKTAIISVLCGLNPCSNGRLSEFPIFSLNGRMDVRLNPCSNGRLSEEEYFSGAEMLIDV